MSERFEAIAPPVTLDRSARPFKPRLFWNDALPDCSAVGLANGLLAIGSMEGFEPVIDDTLVPAFYASCVGVPATLDAMATTDGARLLDVLQRQGRDGFDVGQEVPLRAFSGPVPLNRASVAHCMAEFGGCYVGVDLCERDMEGAAVWDDDGVQPLGAQVGGHCIWLWDYLRLDDTGTGRAATWGTLQRFTMRWLDRRAREAWAVWWRQLMPAAVSAVDEARLAEARALG